MSNLFKRYLDVHFRRKSKRVEMWPGAFVWYHPRIFGLRFQSLALSLHRNGAWRTGPWVTYLVEKA